MKKTKVQKKKCAKSNGLGELFWETQKQAVPLIAAHGQTYEDYASGVKAGPFIQIDHSTYDYAYDPWKKLNKKSK